MKLKELHFGTLVLKQISATKKNAQQIFDIFSSGDDTFKYWLEYTKPYRNVQEVIDEYKNKYKPKGFCKYAMYGIFKGDEILGEIGMGCIYTRRKTAEIGFWLKKSARGRGIIDKLLPIIEKLAFTEYDLHKLTIWCDNENKPVKRIAKKHGYVKEGVLREEKTWPDGSVHSTVLYGKLKSEWKMQSGGFLQGK